MTASSAPRWSRDHGAVMLESRTPGVHWYFCARGPSRFDRGTRCALPLFVSFHIGYPVVWSPFGDRHDTSKGRNWNFNVQFLVWSFYFGRRVRQSEDDRP